MIWLGTTFSTEILTTIIASDSELRHMRRRLHRQRLALIVLLAHLHLSRHHLHHISALAANEVRVVLDQTHELSLVNSLLVILRNELLALKIGYLLVAPWALHWL